MATIISYSNLDMTDLNFYRVTQGSYASHLYTNYTYNGVLYPSVVEVDWQNSGYYRASIFAGSGILLDANRNVIAGTVNGYAELVWNGSWFPLWTITDFSTSASALYQAFLTPNTADDFAIIGSVLSGNDVISTGAGNDILVGFGGNDIINGGSGADTLTGGTGQDTFVFAPGGGADVVTDFVAGAGIVDRLDLVAFAEIHNLNDALSFAAQVGANTVFNFGGGDTLTLQNVVKTSLTADDFAFAKVVGVADYNGDGKADILWQNDSGLPAIWTMNGTAATGGAALVIRGLHGMSLRRPISTATASPIFFGTTTAARRRSGP